MSDDGDLPKIGIRSIGTIPQIGELIPRWNVDGEEVKEGRSPHHFKPTTKLNQAGLADASSIALFGGKMTLITQSVKAWTRRNTIGSSTYCD